MTLRLFFILRVDKNSQTLSVAKNPVSSTGGDADGIDTTINNIERPLPGNRGIV